MFRTMILAVASLALAVCPGASADPLGFTGVNLAGGEFYKPTPGVRPRYGRQFEYTNQAEIDYFASQGMNIFRYQFLWETLQPEARKPLDRTEIDRLKACVRLATSRKLIVLLDPHNYARYYGKVVGSPDVSFADFADFWKRLAAEFADDPYVWFGLVNEPHGMPTKQWFDAANAAIASIRSAGAKNLILVPGNAWTGAHSWTSDWYGGSNAAAVLAINDPLDYWVIEVHQYLDADSSGTKPQVAGPTVGSQRLSKFVTWCREHHKRAVLGEFAVPATPEGKAAIEDMLHSMERDRDVWLGWTWWAAGPRWGNYMFDIEPKKAKDRPQMPWLRPFLHGATMPQFTLTVAGGTGRARVPAAASHPIVAAPAPAGMVFDKWTGDTAWLDNPASPTATVPMPFKDIRIEATYRKAQ